MSATQILETQTFPDFFLETFAFPKTFPTNFWKRRLFQIFVLEAFAFPEIFPKTEI